jgi:hypothetical protein
MNDIKALDQLSVVRTDQPHDLVSCGRGFHAMRRRTNKSPAGASVLMLGMRIGYWPCLKAPFVQLTFWCWLFDIWYGEKSYK